LLAKTSGEEMNRSATLINIRNLVYLMVLYILYSFFL
jgi:hypothetical protein